MKHSHLSLVLTKAALYSSSFALLMVAIACFGDGRRASIGTAMSPTKVAKTLDLLIQPRFQVDAGVFGNSRIGVRGHDMVLDKEVATNFEKQLEAKTKKANRVYTVGFFHCAGRPGKFKPNEDPDSKGKQSPVPPKYDMFYLAEKKIFTNGADGAPAPEAAAWDKKYSPSVQSLCVKALPTLKQGESVDEVTGKWLVAMRPIRALKASCISCHAGAHKGDTLGVMVYTINKTTLAP